VYIVVFSQRTVVELSVVWSQNVDGARLLQDHAGRHVLEGLVLAHSCLVISSMIDEQR
jgi:hypothetical protein